MNGNNNGNSKLDQIITLLSELKAEMQPQQSVVVKKYQDGESGVTFTFKIDKAKQRMSMLQHSEGTNMKFTNRKVSTFKGIALCIAQAVTEAES